LKSKKRAHLYKEDQIADIVEKIIAYRGYNQDKIKNLVDKIRQEHGYSTRQMTKILEKLNDSDQYGVLHYGALFNNVPFCRCLIEDYHCSKIFYRFLMTTAQECRYAYRKR
jgi:hypothetical protein